MERQQPGKTHDVTNQVPPLADYNLFASDAALVAALEREGAPWHRDALLRDGAAILEDALAGVDCVIEEMLPRHGHVIIIGRVREILLPTDGQPLLYWQGAYRQIVHNQPEQK